MTTRLNDGFVEMSNFKINFLSGFENGSIELNILRAIRTRCSFPRVGQFLKFKHLFADWFFVFKERKNALKNRIQLFARYSPEHLIAASRKMAFIQKMELASKSFRSPIEKWRFGVVTLKLTPVTGSFAPFVHGFADVKTTLGINKSGQISKVFLRWRKPKTSCFQLRFNGLMDQITVMFYSIHLVYDRLSSFRVQRISEHSEQLAFLPFFNQIWLNMLKGLQSLFAKHKVIRGNAILLSRIPSADSTVEMLFKPLKVFEIHGHNAKCILEKWRRFYSTYIKTPVAVDITSCVGKISRPVHAI